MEGVPQAAEVDPRVNPLYTQHGGRGENYPSLSLRIRPLTAATSGYQRGERPAKSYEGLAPTGPPMALVLVKALPRLLWVGLALISAISLTTGFTGGLIYDTATSVAYYSSFFKIVALTMGALLIGVILARRALDAKAKDLEIRILNYAQRNLGWRNAGWDEKVERDLRAAIAAGNPALNPQELAAALGQHGALLERSQRVATLAAAPLAGMALILAVSAWALPSSDYFLSVNAPALNAALIHFVTYGSIFSIAGGLAFLPFHFKK